MKRLPVFLISLLIISFFYVHLPQAQAAQEVIGLVRQDCTGYSNCYTSLSAWEAAYGGIDFGSCAKGDLVCADKIAVAKIDGTWTQPDTKPVTIDGWTTSPNNYIRIYAMPEARHKGIGNTGYRLKINASNISAIATREDYVRFEYLDVSLTDTYPSGLPVIGISGNANEKDIRVIGLIIHDSSSAGSAVSNGIQWSGMNNPNASLYVINTLIYNCDGSGISVSGGGGNTNVYVYDSTIVNNAGIGIRRLYVGTLMIKNTYAGGNAKDYSYDGGTTLITSASSDSSGSAGLRNITVSDSVGAYFVNLKNGSENFHIQSSSLLKNAGTDLSVDANLAFSDDIDGQTRSAPWDIGADEAIISIDTTPPVRYSGSPSGILILGTTQTTLSLSTSENAVCKYSTTAGVDYSSMTDTFTTTGGTSHSQTITGLTNGATYNYYVRCQDTAGNANADDYPISFSLERDKPASITNVKTTNITGTSAVITWTTNEAADSQIDYGIDYGNEYSTPIDSNFTLSHSVVLSGLNPGTVYRYRVKSKDGGGNLTVDPINYGFTTLPPDGAAFYYSLGSAGPRNVVQGHPINIAISGKLLLGASEGISLNVENLPANTTYSFPNKQWFTNFGSSLRIETNDNTPIGVYIIKITGKSWNTGLVREIPYTFNVNPAPQPLSYTPVSAVPPIPNLAKWESQMQSFGQTYCNRDTILSQGGWEGSIWYYDGERVFYQIADYTKDSKWNQCAQYVEEVYRDGEVMPSSGRIGGWRVFPHGLCEDFKRTGDTLSKDAAILLSKKSAYASAGGEAGTDLSRETAFILEAYLVAEELGEPRHPKFATAVEFALGHIDQWFVSKTTTVRVAPFMVGLTSEVLIQYYEKTKDPRIPPAIKIAMDWLWDNAWIPEKKAFYYESLNSLGAAPDLNLLIAPAYAWLYQQTGDAKYQERGDQIFSGGVDGAWLGGGKQFSQNYRWSFKYVDWRTNPVPPLPPSCGDGLCNGAETCSSCPQDCGTCPDTQAPSIPTSLTAAAILSSQINLSWTTSTDNIGVTDYRIYRNGSPLTGTTSQTTYSDTGLSPSTTYTYTVAAYDAAGNVSKQSTPASVTALSALKGDVTGDAKVDILDIRACVNHILGIQNWGAAADVNQDGVVNVSDVQEIVNIILKIL
jgi:chitodextrinase